METYIGNVIMFTGNFSIVGWAYCDGASLPISSNEALFSILGTTFGGDGVQTFNLPNLQGRVPIGMNNAHPLGQAGGTESVLVTSAQMPAHNHAITVNATSAAPASGSPAGALIATQPRSGTATIFATGNADTAMANTEIVVSPTGVGNQPFTTVQPYLAINYLIAIEGIYPSRN